jgi:hypothetical protein
MSVDPLRQLTGATCGFASHDPVNEGDPSGLCAAPKPGTKAHEELCAKLRKEQIEQQKQSKRALDLSVASIGTAEALEREADRQPLIAFIDAWWLRRRAKAERAIGEQAAADALTASTNAINLGKKMRDLKCPEPTKSRKGGIA